MAMIQDMMTWASDDSPRHTFSEEITTHLRFGDEQIPQHFYLLSAKRRAEEIIAFYNRTLRECESPRRLISVWARPYE